MDEATVMVVSLGGYENLQTVRLSNSLWYADTYTRNEFGWKGFDSQEKSNSCLL